MSIRSKVFIVIPTARIGGDNHSILNLCKHLNQKKFEIHFIVENPDGILYSKIKSFGKVHSFTLDHFLIIKKIILFPIFRYIYKFLKKIYFSVLISKINPSLIYINTIRRHDFSRFALNYNIPIVVHAHEMGLFVELLTSRVWVQKLVDQAKILICCAESVKEYYHINYQVPNEKMQVIYGPALLNSRNLPKFPSQRSEIVVGSVALDSYLKGMDSLIMAAQLVFEQTNLSVRFEWLGARKTDFGYANAMENHLRELRLSDRFKLLPPSLDTENFISNLDIFVLSSRLEAFPLVILEAMLLEKPVVAMDVGGIREVVDIETGYLVINQTPEGLAQGILHFIHNADLRSKIGKNGKKRVLENFEAEGQAKKWVEILNSI